MKRIIKHKLKPYIIGIIFISVIIFILYVLWLPNIRLSDEKKLIDYKHTKYMVAANIVASIEDQYGQYYMDKDENMIVVANDKIEKIFVAKSSVDESHLYPHVLDYNELEEIEQYYYQILRSRLNVPKELKLKDCKITIYTDLYDTRWKLNTQPKSTWYLSAPKN